jgi:pilus assembly protein Flp/PilA
MRVEDAREKSPMNFTINCVSRVRALFKNEEGQDLLEYALLIALIAIVCVGAVGLAGNKVSTVFTAIAGSIPSA